MRCTCSLLQFPRDHRSAAVAPIGSSVTAGPVTSSVIVAVPARDEEGTIDACLRSIDVAAAAVPLPVTIVVAADSCSDDTALRARQTTLHSAEFEVVQGEWGTAGAARAAAVAYGLSRSSIPTSDVWIANTDADCTVPADWLEVHLDFATDHVVVAGVVGLSDDAPSGLRSRFATTYELWGPHHPHVHGANIGVRADAYRSVGGWCTCTPVGEDHRLWHALRTAGYRGVQSTLSRVVTSARTHSRVRGGFATDLRALDGSAAPILVAAGAAGAA